MKQLKQRSLAILLVFAMVCAMFPSLAFAASSTPYDGEGSVKIEWAKLNRVKQYQVTLYYEGNPNPLGQKTFSASATNWDVTNYVKQNGPGKYIANLVVTYISGAIKHAENYVDVYQMTTPDAPSIAVDKTSAVVNWTAAPDASLGYIVSVSLTEADGETVVAQKDYRVEDPAATSQDITDFVAQYADHETPLTLSATLTVMGDLTVNKRTHTSYLNSDPSDPAVCDKLVGVLPTGVITSTEVAAEPGMLTVNYELQGGAVDSTYVEQLKLTLVCEDGENLNQKVFYVNAPADSGTIDVTGLVGNPGEYTWTVTLLPKFVTNAQTVNQDGGTVVYTVYPLPAPVLTVADDASSISWPAVNADPDVVSDPTLIDDPDRYEVYVKESGNPWQTYTGGAVVYDDATGEMSVDISGQISEGQTKSFKIRCNNKNQNPPQDVLDLRFTDFSESVVEVYKAIAPTNVQFDVTTYAYENPPTQDDLVYLMWTLPSSTDGIDHYLVSIYMDGELVQTFTTDDADTASIDVTEAIDNENVNAYTASIVSIGQHENADYSHFDADSGVAYTAAGVLSGAVATVDSSAKIKQEGEVLVLVADVIDSNDNIDEVESIWVSNLKNGKNGYEGPIQGELRYDAESETYAVVFDLSEIYEGQNQLKPGTWTATVSVYSYNNGLNADTETTVSALYDPDKLILDDLTVDLETGEVSWDPAEASDGTQADYYKVKLEYLSNGDWKGVKVVGGDDTAEWETITDTYYVIQDSDSPDGGMLPGRIYRVNVQAFSNTPLEYVESDVKSAKLCKFPAVVADITDADYTAGSMSWTSTFTYPDDATFEINAGEYTDTTDASPYSLYELLDEYGTYSATVTVLGEVYDGIHYVQSDVSNAVTAYRGVLPAVEIEDESVVFTLGAGGTLNLSFTLPTAGEDSSDYDQAMIDAIDPTGTVVEIYSIKDAGTDAEDYALLGTYLDEDGDGVVDVTYANNITTPPDTKLENINLDGGVKVVIKLASKTEYVDDYNDYEAGVASAEDAIKVVSPIVVPAREKLNLSITIDTATGDVLIADNVQSDAQPKWTGSITVGNMTENDPDASSLSFPTSASITAGKEGTVTVKVTDESGKYADNEATIRDYKLVDPEISELKKNNGTLVFTKDDTDYAYTKDVTFATAEEDPYTGASYNPDDDVVTFDLTVEPQEVTVNLAFVGGYDEPNDIYVIDADNDDSIAVDAGLSPILSNPELYIDSVTGHQILKLKIDDQHPYYSIAWETTPTSWANVTISAKAGSTELNYTLKWNPNVKNNDGYVVIDLTDSDTSLSADKEYTITVKNDTVRDHCKAVVGARPDYVVGTVSYTAKQLVVSDLQVVDFETGLATWTADENATEYKVTVKRWDGSDWIGVREGTVAASDAPEYLLDAAGGYEAGKLYMLSVIATSTDAAYADSEETSITIYRLADPVITAINDDATIDYTVDEAYDHYDTFDANNGATVDADTATVTFNLEQEPVDVTVTLTSTGKYDETNDVYVLDAENAATATKTAGYAPLFKNAVLAINPDTGHQILTLEIDTENPLYGESWSATPHNWSNVKIVLNGDGSEISKQISHKNNVRPNPGYIVIDFETMLKAGVEYNVIVKDAIKDEYSKIVGIRPDYSAGVVGFTAKNLRVSDLAVTNFTLGTAEWTVNEASKVAKYQVTVSNDLGSGWTATYDVDAADPSFTLSADEVNDYMPGVVYTLKVKAISNDAAYADSEESSITIYRLDNPVINAINDDGTIDYTVDEAYDHDDAFDADNGATVDADTATVTFDLEQEPVVVTVTLTSTGKYDEANDVYVLDAALDATGTKTAGYAPVFMNAALAINPDTGHQIVTLEIDTENPLYGESWSATPHKWQNVKIVLSGGGKEISRKITHKDNVRPNPGFIVIDFVNDLDDGVTYNVIVKDAIKDEYSQIVGVRPDYSAGVVGFTAKALTVSNLAVTDFATGEASWSVNEASKVDKYQVTVSNDLGSGWTATYDVDAAAPTFTLSDDGTNDYVPGVVYTLKVKAISNDAAYTDSEEVSIKIYRLMDPTISRINNDATINYTVDTAYDHDDAFDADNGATVDADNATVTFKLDQEPVVVTVTLTSTGKYDEANDVYVLDAESAATGKKVAGLAPILQDPRLVVDSETGHTLLIVSIDTTNLLYKNDKDYSSSPNMWNQVEISLNDADGKISKNITFAGNIKGNGGDIVIDFGDSLTAGVAYTVKVKDAIKSGYAKIAGLRPEYSLTPAVSF